MNLLLVKKYIGDWGLGIGDWGFGGGGGSPQPQTPKPTTKPPKKK